MLPPAITKIDHCAFYKCTSLTSVHLPENLISISILAFAKCPNLTTIKAPSFSTTTLDNNNIDGFKNMLVEAGFSRSCPNDIFRGRPTRKNSWDALCSVNFPHPSDMYHDIKTWARTRGVNSRLPLFTAAARSLKWSYTKQIFTENMPAVYESDELTGLPLFMLAATGPTSDIESIYSLLKENPSAMPKL